MHWGDGAHLFSCSCSVVLRGGRKAANKYHWHVRGNAHSVWATLGLPQLTVVCAFPVYTAKAPGCSAGELSKAGLGLCALPRSKLLRFRFLGTPQRHRLSWACVLCPSRSEQLRQPGAWWARCPMWTVSRSPPQSWPLGFLGVPQGCRLSCAVCLLWGSDLWLWSSGQMSTSQDPRKSWSATGNLLTVWWRMPSLGPRLPLAFQLWLSPACLSSSGGVMGQSVARCLPFGVCSVVCFLSGPGCPLG